METWILMWALELICTQVQTELIRLAVCSQDAFVCLLIKHLNAVTELIKLVLFFLSSFLPKPIGPHTATGTHSQYVLQQMLAFLGWTAHPHPNPGGGLWELSPSAGVSSLLLTEHSGTVRQHLQATWKTFSWQTGCWGSSAPNTAGGGAGGEGGERGGSGGRVGGGRGGRVGGGGGERGGGGRIGGGRGVGGGRGGGGDGERGVGGGRGGGGEGAGGGGERGVVGGRGGEGGERGVAGGRGGEGGGERGGGGGRGGEWGGGGGEEEVEKEEEVEDEE